MAFKGMQGGPGTVAGTRALRDITTSQSRALKDITFELGRPVISIKTKLGSALVNVFPLFDDAITFVNATKSKAIVEVNSKAQHGYFELGAIYSVNKIIEKGETKTITIDLSKPIIGDSLAMAQGIVIIADFYDVGGSWISRILSLKDQG